MVRWCTEEVWKCAIPLGFLVSSEKRRLGYLLRPLWLLWSYCRNCGWHGASINCKTRIGKWKCGGARLFYTGNCLNAAGRARYTQWIETKGKTSGCSTVKKLCWCEIAGARMSDILYTGVIAISIRLSRSSDSGALTEGWNFVFSATSANAEMHAKDEDKFQSKSAWLVKSSRSGLRKHGQNCRNPIGAYE